MYNVHSYLKGFSIEIGRLRNPHETKKKMLAQIFGSSNLKKNIHEDFETSIINFLKCISIRE